jgi:hypothetical protein
MRMLSGWIRIFALVAVVALFANAHAYANCVSMDCGAAPAPSNSCHSHEHPQSDGAHCTHGHAEVAIPQTCVGKVSLAQSVGILDSATALTAQSFAPVHNGPPPGGNRASKISVLRV